MLPSLQPWEKYELGGDCAFIVCKHFLNCLYCASLRSSTGSSFHSCVVFGINELAYEQRRAAGCEWTNCDVLRRVLGLSVSRVFGIVSLMNSGITSSEFYLMVHLQSVLLASVRQSANSQLL